MVDVPSETRVDHAQPVEKSIVAGMLQPYLLELSAHTGQVPAGDGRFRYPYLEAYWHEPERHPFVIRNEKNVVGFALVREVPGGSSIAEFFVKPEHRRRGHGKSAAVQIFRTFPGKWAVTQQLTNAAAQTFWRRAIREVDPKYAERVVTTEDGRSLTAQRFVVPG